jgi:hypothetical protein
MTQKKKNEKRKNKQRKKKKVNTGELMWIEPATSVTPFQPSPRIPCNFPPLQPCQLLPTPANPSNIQAHANPSNLSHPATCHLPPATSYMTDYPSSSWSTKHWLALYILLFYQTYSW